MPQMLMNGGPNFRGVSESFEFAAQNGRCSWAYRGRKQARATRLWLIEVAHFN
jgi:hypothetical protein